jgi:hypothetical protein
VAARAMPPMHRRGLGGTSELAPWPSLPRNSVRLAGSSMPMSSWPRSPDVRRWHRQRNIPDDVSWATLADLGRHLPVNRRVHGEGGLDRPLWLRSHFRGALYQLGRLQFCRSRIPYEPAMLEHLAVPFRYGDPALDLHIPEQGPLTPPACNRSLRWARDFFPRHFSAERYRVAICTSWLLDDQLAAYLKPDSNIIRFQRRFSLLLDSSDGDDDVLILCSDGSRPPWRSYPSAPASSAPSSGTCRPASIGRSARAGSNSDGERRPCPAPPKSSAPHHCRRR